MSTALVKLVWEAREPPLPVSAVLARDVQASAIAQALFLDDSRRLRCVVVWSGDWILVIGEDLPWVDGATWLGQVDGLFMPTALQPTIANVLVSDAIFRNRRKTSIAVITPEIALTSDMPVGPPPLEMLAAAAGIST
jgi:hypothetical protein